MLLCATVYDYLVAASTRALPPSDRATLVVDRLDRGHVLALDATARTAGARAGQTITQALAAAPQALVVVFDAEHARRLWEDVLDSFDALTPLIDDARPGVAFLDMRGIDGNAKDWMERAREIARSFGLTLHLGIGANKFCAYAAAWIEDGSTLDEGCERSRLAPLPLDLLQLDRDAVERLRVLGVSTLGELAALPHGPFVRRFGRQAARWHECARGIDRTPFTPRGHAIAIEAALFGEGRAEDEAQVLFALRVLLARVCSDLERSGKRSGMLQLDVELEDGAIVPLEMLLSLPTSSERAMLELLRAKLEGMTFTAAIVGLRVRALRLEEGGEALPLFSAGEIDLQNVALALARLETTLGEPAKRARVRAAHPLEERFTYEPFVLTREDVRQLPDAAAPSIATEAVPQIRLLSVREIDVRVQRGEPAFVGSPPRAVLECAGPWRVEEGWFASPVTRDEYDVVLEGGDVFRIYRQGTRWYLRGSYD